MAWIRPRSTVLDQWSCKLIPDDFIVDAVRNTPGRWHTWDEIRPEIDKGSYPRIPDKVVIAKVRSLVRKGRLHACVHSGSSKARNQCRGDIHLPEECEGC